VQEQLHASPFGAQIEAAPYLERLCESLAASMIAGDPGISLRVAMPAKDL
jgi:two-component sensor histidine kinase